AAGFPVRVMSRRLPRYVNRVPGVEYVTGNLAKPLEPAVTAGIRLIAHRAAETAGGKAEHEKKAILPPPPRIQHPAGIHHGVIHVSSIAVLKPGAGALLDESSPVDAGNLDRGPYVWGKAESEIDVQRLGQELGVPVKIIRPGPLVDYASFHAPGRLGRELGP